VGEFGRRFAAAASFDEIIGQLDLAQLSAAGAGSAGSESKPLEGGCNLLWALSHVDSSEARRLVRDQLAVLSGNEEVRSVALQGVSLWRDAAALQPVVELLFKGSATHRRLAAESLGRIGDAAAVPSLLGAAAILAKDAREPTSGSVGIGPEYDRALEHALTYALIEIGDPVATARGLSSDNLWTRRVALIALDQMPGGGLTSEQVVPLLASSEPLLRDTAHWIVGHRADWGSDLAGYFHSRLVGVGNESPAADAPAVAAVEDLQRRLARFAANPTIETRLAEWAAGEVPLPLAGRLLALRVMADAKPREMPASWAKALVAVIAAHGPRQTSSSPDPLSETLLASAVATTRQLNQPKKPYAELNEALLRVAEDDRLKPLTRLDAMAAVAGGMPTVSESQFGLLLASLLPDQPVTMRSSAADSIARAHLDAGQLDRLTETVKSIGPLELDRLLAPFERSTDERLGLKLVSALKQALSLTSLRLDSLQQKLAKYPPAVQQGVTELVAAVNAEAAQQKQRIEELLPEVARGDIRRGQAVFNAAKSACVACHRFGYVGGNVGPDLTRIGSIRADRDLLEAILFPSLSFVRSYESVVLVTTDGRIVNGLIRNETAEEIVLATGLNQETKVARSEIDEIRPSSVSVMPAGLDKQLSVQELADLVSFLKNAK
jgi:putative heme-binding domain-containing protein